MLKIDMDDCNQKFKNTIMMVDGSAKFITAILSQSQFKAIDLRSDEAEVVEVNERNLKAPARIGMVQVNNGVAYVSRNAARMYKAGIDKANLCVQPLEAPRGGTSRATILSFIQRLVWPGIAEALENDYPPLSVAMRRAKQNKGTYAFDKQFAVDCDYAVWYKTHCVGDVVKGKIVFHDSAVSLQCLLGEQNA